MQERDEEIKNLKFDPLFVFWCVLQFSKYIDFDILNFLIYFKGSGRQHQKPRKEIWVLIFIVYYKKY